MAEKGGVLSVQATGHKRHLVAMAAGVCMIAAPLALLAGGGASSVAASAPTQAAHFAVPTGDSVKRAVALRDLQLANNRVVIPTTTTTAAPPVTTAPRPVTTTTAPRRVYVAPPTTAPPAPSFGRSVSGQATYYGVGAGACASHVAPRGALLHVTNTSTGASITCTVSDYEAAPYPRVVDLSSADFGRLASLDQGVISVTISW